MDRKGILFIPLSYNADSMKNIINIVFCNQYCSDNKLPYVEKIYVWKSKWIYSH